MSNLPVSIFCDGGVCGPNPSNIGGTWCWCWVDDQGERTKVEHGIVTPRDIKLPTVTNNVTELLAALYALESVPVAWEGTLYTDSLITLRRVTTSSAFKNVPNDLRIRVLDRRRTRKYKVKLLAGHPTKADLRLGYKGKFNKPVSEHNHFCDLRCRALSQAYLKSLSV